MMKIPYPREKIMLALMGLDDSILEKSEVQDSIRQRLDVKQPELNIQAAQYHGISVIDLINSPNYDHLITQYHQSLVVETVQYLESQGYSNIEAWSVICVIFEAV